MASALGTYAPSVDDGTRCLRRSVAMSPAGWPLDGPAEIVHNGCPSNLSTTTPLPRLACLPVVSASPPLYRQLRDGSLTWLTINVCAGSDWVPRPGGQTAEKPFVAGGGTRHGHWSGFLRATSTSQHAMLFAMACFVFHVISDRGMERGGGARGEMGDGDDAIQTSLSGS